MLHHTLNFGRELQEQLDRQNYIKQDTNERNLKLQTSFQDEGDGSVGMKIKGEVKGGGTDKTEKRKRQQENKGEKTGTIGFQPLHNMRFELVSLSLISHQADPAVTRFAPYEVSLSHLCSSPIEVSLCRPEEAGLTS